MKNPLPTLFLLLTCTLLAPQAQAEKADRSKPMNVEADTLRYDDVKQVSVFSGNVVLTKGSIIIRAAQIDVRQDADGYQFGIITGTPDKPAFFRQKREALDEFIEGESELIEYDGRADVVKFLRKATLRRLRGAALADEITGGLIVYENLTDTFSVDGNTAKGAVPVPGQRVRAMLTPKPEGAAASAPAPQPKAQPDPSAPALRATTTLGSAPK
ncbi:MAG: lipopolysaccharide transport periplasmic protein LptA [Rhodoferax sp.]|jgi:lipopolysaccharide export system protein LptA